MGGFLTYDFMQDKKKAAHDLIDVLFREKVLAVHKSWFPYLKQIKEVVEYRKSVYNELHNLTISSDPSWVWHWRMWYVLWVALIFFCIIYIIYRIIYVFWNQTYINFNSFYGTRLNFVRLKVENAAYRMNKYSFFFKGDARPYNQLVDDLTKFSETSFYSYESHADFNQILTSFKDFENYMISNCDFKFSRELNRMKLMFVKIVEENNRSRKNGFIPFLEDEYNF